MERLSRNTDFRHDKVQTTFCVTQHDFVHTSYVMILCLNQWGLSQLPPTIDMEISDKRNKNMGTIARKVSSHYNNTDFQKLSKHVK